MGAGGAGGGVSARTGRVAALTIGPYTLKSPLTLFTQDESGAFAEADLQGNIGQPLLSRFKLFLDYGRDRIIFEPTASLAEPFDRAFSGLAFEAQGKDYATFRVRDVLEHSPASEAGIRVDDVVTRVDDRAIAQTSLSELLEMLEKPVARKLTIRRGNDVRTVVLTPRRLV
jgi:C-terminal processing protease CtpA/Prc